MKGKPNLKRWSSSKLGVATSSMQLPTKYAFPLHQRVSSLVSFLVLHLCALYVIFVGKSNGHNNFLYNLLRQSLAEFLRYFAHDFMSSCMVSLHCSLFHEFK